MDQWPASPRTEIHRKNWPSSKDIMLLVKSKIANPISKMDDYVQHVFREHNQEADHWANLGADGQRKIGVDKGNDTERWKAVQGFWDGTSRVNKRSVCGFVIKGVDVEKWITISKIAVPLGIGTTMEDEVVGVCVPTSILDLVLHKVSASKIKIRVSTQFFQIADVGSVRKRRKITSVWKRQVTLIHCCGRG